jgi:peptidoglycan/LPS O-acetylase OafA/YrhL
MAIRPAATCIHEAAMTGPMNAIVGTETTIRSFEGARGLAALSVALFHFGLGKEAIVRIPAGYLFVDLFFVLSGFLICATYAHRLGAPGSLPLFLVRRIGRLLPLLLVATLAYVAMLDAAVLAHRLLEPDKPPPPLILPAPKELLATLTMTHSLGLFDHVILNYASWSISTEFYAYLVFALLCLLLRGRARLLAFAVVALAAWLVSAWASVRLRQCLHWGGCFDLTFDYGYWRCLAGFFLGALFSQLRPGAPPWRMPALVQGLAQGLALAALLAMFLLVRRWPALGLGAPLLFGLFLLSVRADRGPLAVLLGANALQVLGRHSYSVYLMHPVILLAWNPWRPDEAGIMDRLLFLCGYVALVCWVAGWTFRLVEEPMRRRFNRYAARRFGSRVPASVGQTPAL